MPVEQCRLAGIEPGDEYQSYVDNDGHITIIKKTPGAAEGVLRDIKADRRVSDENSMHSGLNT